ncbi:MAG TPA: hypothetical protein VGM70_05610 [Pseudolysinimonas sp.]|jgi:hypothetical protein
MSETTAADTTVEPSKLTLLGDVDAASCDGEFCELPAHREHSVMNRRVDEDRI